MFVMFTHVVKISWFREVNIKSDSKDMNTRHSIKYKSGNKKIQIKSTKCQYNPVISTGV